METTGEVTQGLRVPHRFCFTTQLWAFSQTKRKKLWQEFLKAGQKQPILFFLSLFFLNPILGILSHGDSEAISSPSPSSLSSPASLLLPQTCP